MRPRIGKKTVSAIRRELLALRIENPTWTSVSTELQDDSRFLLAAISMEVGLSEREYEIAKDICAKIISAYVGDDADEYTWMVVVKIGNEVIESKMSNIES